MPNKLQWGRIIAGAFLVELVLIIVFVPILQVVDIATLIPYVLVGVFVVGFAISWWILRKAREHHVLHGTLIGILATALYLALGMFAPGGLGPIVEAYGLTLFVVGNGLRIVSCAFGGYVAAQSV